MTSLKKILLTKVETPKFIKDYFDKLFEPVTKRVDLILESKYLKNIFYRPSVHIMGIIGFLHFLLFGTWYAHHLFFIGLSKLDSSGFGIYLVFSLMGIAIIGAYAIGLFIIETIIVLIIKKLDLVKKFNTDKPKKKRRIYKMILLFSYLYYLFLALFFVCIYLIDLFENITF